MVKWSGDEKRIIKLKEKDKKRKEFGDGLKGKDVRVKK